MFIPKLFQIEEEKEILNFIKKNGFAIIVSNDNNGLVATHIPLILHQNEAGEYCLLGHFSKANPHAKTIVANENQELLVIFNGAHTFVTADWYEKENVSTWNYMAVHAYCTARLIEGAELYDSLQRLSDKYETSNSKARLENLTDTYVRREMRGITGFELKILRLEGKAKLSQNRNDKDHQHIVEQLEVRNEGDDQRVADEMRKNRAN